MAGYKPQTNYLKSEPFFIWVLAPQLETDDPNLQYYYDFTENIKEFTRAFETLKLQWKWQYVTVHNYKEIIDRIADSENGHIPLVFNLCDGDEVNGTPGISVVKYLEQKNLIYTGARESYYEITTSKIPMKQAFDDAQVANSPWIAIQSPSQSLDGVCEKLGTPLIIKPAVSGGSMGLGVKNVVKSDHELKDVVKELYNGYRGWDFTFGGLVAEKFIAGPEFTTFIVGSYDKPEHAIIYQPVERVFNNKLPDHEKFLSFDRLWETYEAERPVGESGDTYEDFYNYFLPSAELEEPLRQLSWDAFHAVKGTGYTRVDIRMDSSTGKLYVLEVNAQCGLSEDENHTSIGAIIRLGRHSFSEMIMAIMENALEMKVRKGSLRSSGVLKK